MVFVCTHLLFDGFINYGNFCVWDWCLCVMFKTHAHSCEPAKLVLQPATNRGFTQRSGLMNAADCSLHQILDGGAQNFLPKMMVGGFTVLDSLFS